MAFLQSQMALCPFLDGRLQVGGPVSELSRGEKVIMNNKDNNMCVIISIFTALSHE